MIAGIGTDIVQTSRIKDMLERHGAVFLERIFARSEAEASSGRADRSQFLAGRWAAKEAFSKALGTGIGKSCRWVEIVVANDAKGKPVLTPVGVTAETLRALGDDVRVHLSISHETDYACATVVIEKFL